MSGGTVESWCRLSDPTLTAPLLEECRSAGWVLLCGETGSETNALLEYSTALDLAMAADGFPTRVEAVAAPRHRSVDRVPLSSLIRPDDSVVVIQYNPFSYGHLGLAPGLVLDALRLRRSRPNLRLALMCHETIALSPGVRWQAIRQLHRAQLAALLRQMDVVFVSTGRWIPTLRALGAQSPIRLPVGSNLPDLSACRDATRESFGLSDKFVVTSFSTGHPSHRDDYLIEAVKAVARVRDDVVVLTLGAGRDALFQGTPTLAERIPGFLQGNQLAKLMAASDLFVSPYVDGVSTRRGTVMTALQHGVPVVATTGESTDDDLATLLGPFGTAVFRGPAAFGAAAGQLATNGAVRRDHGQRGQNLYRSQYDWPVIAAQMRSAITGHAAGW